MFKTLLMAVGGLIFVGYEAGKLDQQFTEIDNNASIPADQKDAYKALALIGAIPGAKTVGSPSDAANNFATIANKDPATKESIQQMLGNLPSKTPQEPNAYQQALSNFVNGLEKVIQIVLDYKWAVLNPLTLADALGLSDWLPDWFHGPADSFDKGPSGLSPLVLDLDGDGVEVSSLAYGAAGSHVYFDMDNDGFAERTAWATGGDGVLAIDKNGNGKIDNQGELFGNTATYANGFLNLKQYDSNADNKITSADAQFANLRVWVDADSDGQTDAGELKTLASLGITQINLAATALTSTYLNGNRVSDTSSFVMGGATRTVSDVWYQMDNRDSHYTGDVTLDVRTLFLPTLKGFGNLKDLHVAMSQNASLLTLVQDFVTNWNIGKMGSAALNTEIQNILFHWAGVENASQTVQMWLMTYPHDGREIAFMQTVTGFPYAPDYFSTKYTDEARIFHTSYIGLFESYKAQLLLQAGAQVLFSEAPVYNLATGEFSGGVLSASALNGLSATAASSGNVYNFWKDVVSLLQTVKIAEAYSASDVAAVNSAITASGSAATWQVLVNDIYDDAQGVVLYQDRNFRDNSYFSTHFVGTNTGDTFYGGYGNDYFKGRGGNDTLSGSAGNDTLDGGSGENRLMGGSGDDVYIHSYGVDTIREESGNDTIRIEGNYTAADLKFSRDILNVADTLNIWVKGQLAIIVEYQFGNGYPMSRIEQIVFDGGAKIDLTVIPGNMSGTSGNDTLTGADHVLMQDDVIYGLEGNDTIKGGKGNDYVNGAQGNDIYQFSLGNGTDVIDDNAGMDTIQLGADVSKASVKFGHIDTNLVVYYGSEDQIIVRNHYYEEKYSYNPGFKIETLRFFDGTTIDLTGALDFIGTSGSENIFGTNWAETLSGLAGNDCLYGGAGSDSYKFSVGDGVDTISETSGAADTILMGAGITAANIRFEKSGANLNVYYGTSDKITVNGHFYDDINGTNSYDEVETLKLADGTTFNLKGGLTFTGTTATDNISGTSMADTLVGLAGNDGLSGGAGSDTYKFSVGDGVDTIYEQSGAADVVLMGTGITAANIRFEKSGTNLNVYYGTSDKITVNGHFYDDTNGTNSYDEVETLKFADGSTINLKSGLTFTGTAAADIVAGTSMADTLVGLAGDDNLSANNGDDVLIGGAGNDYLSGGAGNDTYKFAIGDGVDTISDQSGAADTILMGAGITAANIRFEKSSYDLNIYYGTSDKIKLSYHFYDDVNAGSSYDEVETLKLADGSTINLKSGLTFTGTTATDNISGTSMADTLVGLAGNDSLSGGTGSDTYKFSVGDGVDTISETSGAADVVLMGTGITAANIRFEKSGTNLNVYYGTSDKITVNGHFYDDTNGTNSYDEVETLKFADGSTINLKSGLTFTGTAAADIVAGTSMADTLVGLAGDDNLSANNGDDVLIGGAGNDYLSGGAGNDTYKFAIGDGVDTIYEQSGTADVVLMGTGITAANIRFEKSSYDLNIYYGTSDKIKLSYHFYDDVNAGSSYDEVETLKLADGTTFNLKGGLTFTGTAAADSVAGTSMADSLVGLAGDDYLYGGSGNDTLIGG
jgi:Ca2+-binding RTX toxin-like protein